MDGTAIPLSPFLVPCSSEGSEKGHFTTSDLPTLPFSGGYMGLAPCPEQPRWEEPTSFEVVSKQTGFELLLTVQRGLASSCPWAKPPCAPQCALQWGDRRTPLLGSGRHPAWLKVFPHPALSSPGLPFLLLAPV